MNLTPITTRHEPDNDGVCIHCAIDLTEAHHLRKLGYEITIDPCIPHPEPELMGDPDEWDEFYIDSLLED